jgi:hypothetical protein
VRRIQHLSGPPHHHFSFVCSCGRVIDTCICTNVTKDVEVVRYGCGLCLADRALQRADEAIERARERR